MIADFDDAYANGPHIDGAEGFPPRWAADAAAFRTAMGARAETGIAYGDHPRETYDLFRPEGAPKGLAVFVHGGYWMNFDPSYWSHLAGGAVARGWAVCLPGYVLAPEAGISAITRQMVAALEHAAGRIDGPLRLAGHSAGGHLVTRMICKDTPLAAPVRQRISHVLSISGLHDVRPLLKTQMNATLGMTPQEALAESPALLEPVTGISLTCAVGADERPEFIRQNDLLANIWTGFGLETRTVHVPGRHHFDVIEALGDPASDMTALFVEPTAAQARTG